jgi:[acyl-carrier-protein] S-malonyltransferase
MDNLIRAELIRDRLATTAFAFRGYNNTNLGRTAELLEHRVYGPIVERYLREDSEACSAATGRKFDLVARVRSRRESSLETFAEDIPLIVAVERAHIALLKEFFDIDFRRSRLALGYSIGEIAALVCSGVYEMQDLLRPLLYLSDDCVELAKTVTMGVVFSRGPALDLDAILRLCTKITAEAHGIIDMSSHLAPNTVLLLGQNETIDRFKELMREALGKQVHLRKNSHKWPPLHTSILWSKNLSNRAAATMQTVKGGFIAPVPPILSMVNGKVAYNDYNSRSLMNRWVDQPQRMWDSINELLTMGIDLILHVGPEPNLIPATFQRISENVNAQVNRWSLKSSLGRRAVMGIVRRPWLAKVITSKAAILRTPFVAHVVVEDWLLAQELP